MRERDSDMIANGKIYQHPNGFTCITQWLSDDMWCLLCGPSKSIRPGGTIFMAQGDREGKWMFARDELDRYIQEKGCVEFVGACVEIVVPEPPPHA